MNINTLRYSLFGIADGQEVDHAFVKFNIYPLTMFALLDFIILFCNRKPVVDKEIACVHR